MNCENVERDFCDKAALVMQSAGKRIATDILFRKPVTIDVYFKPGDYFGKRAVGRCSSTGVWIASRQYPGRRNGQKLVYPQALLNQSQIINLDDKLIYEDFDFKIEFNSDTVWNLDLELLKIPAKQADLECKFNSQ